MEITLTPEQSSDLFYRAYGASAVAEAADFDLTASNRDIEYPVLHSGDMKSHTPGGPDKSENDDELETVEVIMRNLYDLIGFNDFEREDEAALADKVVAATPDKLGKAIDKSVFGTTFWPGGPFASAITTNVSDVDETPESWQAALDSITDAGYTPNLVLLTNQARKVLKEAYVVDANTNTLRDGNVTEIDGVPVRFKALKTGALSTNDICGMAGDFTVLKAVLKDTLEVNTYEAKSDLAARLKNKDYIYTGSRFGRTAVDEDAFTLLRYVDAGS